MTDKKVWFLTGAGRGMGVDITRAALAMGHRVVATGRNTDAVASAIGLADNLLVVKLDVTRSADAQTALRAAVDRSGAASMKLRKLILWILLSVVMASCGNVPQPASPSPNTLNTAAPSSTATVTRTLTPSVTATLLFATYFKSATPKPSATIAPTATPLPVITTPEAGANAYRLKPWDKAAALQMLSQAANLSISKEYAGLRGFYQTSLLYEAWLDFPDLRQDAGLLQQMAEGKLSSDSPYGFVHDRSVEPFLLLLQQALNDGSVQPDTLGPWLANLGDQLDETSYTSNRIFDQPYHTQVVKIFIYGSGSYWDYFAIRTDQPGRYSVFAIYPEWEQVWWSDESFQIADVNGNGKDDIAIRHEDWSTGYTHWCGKSFSLYEWDGAAFKNLMIDQPHVVLDYSGPDGCLDATWSPDSTGGNEIQIGTRRFTPCEDVTYDDFITFRWNGQGYVQAPGHTIPAPKNNQPDRCTLAWAVWAGPENPLAVDLLTAALADWPQEADQDWGPAARDYFRLKLATWDIRIGKLTQGLKLLQEARSHPYAPAYPLSTKVAATFLDSYAANGWYRAAQDVHALYLKELTAYTTPCIFLCTLDNLSQVWGFAERQWGFEYPTSFTDDFQAIGALSLQLNIDHPNNLEELIAWLERNGVQPVWSVVSDLDGNGENDWLVVIKNSNPVVRYDQLGNMLTAHPGTVNGGSDDQYNSLYAFLHIGGEIKPIFLDSILILSKLTPHEFGWRNFRPAPGIQPVNVLQAGTDLYAFRLVEANGAYQVEKDVESWSIPAFRSDDPVVVQDWKIDAGKLVVQYNGREAVYAWDPARGRLAPTWFAPELQEENIGRIERALYVEDDPQKALEILKGLLGGHIWENNYSYWSIDMIYYPRLVPYLEYLIGLAYERAGNQASAVQAYWQLWHDYPSFPFSIAAQSKLERR